MRSIRLRRTPATCLARHDRDAECGFAWRPLWLLAAFLGDLGLIRRFSGLQPGLGFFDRFLLALVDVGLLLRLLGGPLRGHLARGLVDLRLTLRRGGVAL